MRFNKSYLKWAGGKGRILPTLIPIIQEYQRGSFVEPFCGALNVSLNLECDHYYINDLNHDLVSCHTHILESDITEIEKYLSVLFDQGFKYYYELRDEFNNTSEPSFRKAMLFIYLNKHGFNGLCRYNKSGGFNVPIGSSKSPKSVPMREIEALKEHFKHYTISNKQFDDGLFEIEDSLVYCDPPYVPITASNFDYTGDGFSYDDQVRLRDKARNSDNTVIISNHYCDITKELYSDADEIHVVDAKRTISANASQRINVQECIVVYK